MKPDQIFPEKKINLQASLFAQTYWGVILKLWIPVAVLGVLTKGLSVRTFTKAELGK